MSTPSFPETINMIERATAKRVSRKSERAKCELGKWPLLVTKEYPSLLILRTNHNELHYLYGNLDH